jgi:hypothetical protein
MKSSMPILGGLVEEIGEDRQALLRTSVDTSSGDDETAGTLAKSCDPTPV